VECAIGFYKNIWSEGAICKACPVGGICSPDGSEEITNQDGFYYMENGTFEPCYPPTACPAGRALNSTFSCYEGFKGLKCATCATSPKKYYRFGNTCNLCPPTTVGKSDIIGAVCAGLIVLWAIIYYYRIVDWGFVTILVTYFQTVSTFFALKLEWPITVVDVLGYLSFFNMNYQIVSPDCISDIDDGGSFEFKFYMALGSPLFVLGIGAAAFCGLFIYRSVSKMM
jgi:hypothetical protein